MPANHSDARSTAPVILPQVSNSATATIFCWANARMPILQVISALSAEVDLAPVTALATGRTSPR